MQSISHVLIVADDLTGACDAAAPFAPATVCLAAEPSGCRVKAYSTESRDLPEPEIAHRMQTIARAAGDAEIIFKKIDSTLRGNVRAEIAAAMSAFHCDACVMTPAFPAMGRSVRNGHLHVDGALVMHAGENVLDAATNEDLDRIVEAGLARSGRILWAGSAGLAFALARRICGPPQPAAPPQIEAPIAFCIGSDHSATLAQLAELEQSRPSARILLIRRGQTTPDKICKSLAGAGALFITGGDTASMVLGATGAQSIVVHQEVVTGVPWGMLSGGIFDGCPIVTKSGGFGAPDTLVRVADFFPCRKP